MLDQPEGTLVEKKLKEETMGERTMAEERETSFSTHGVS